MPVFSCPSLSLKIHLGKSVSSDQPGPGDVAQVDDSLRHPAILLVQWANIDKDQFFYGIHIEAAKPGAFMGERARREKCVVRVDVKTEPVLHLRTACTPAIIF